MKPIQKKLGQKGGVWGKQGFGGYPGLKFTAEEITQYIPVKQIYVEPFAGKGRTAYYIKRYKTMVLNDKGDYAVSYLKKHFKKAMITQVDYMECIRFWDSESTVFLVDPPWVTSVYTENSLTFCDRPASQYYDEFIKESPNLKGDWVLCSNMEGPGATRINKAVEDFGYYKIEVKSRKNAIFGCKARTLLMSNKPFEVWRPLNQSLEKFL